MNGTNVLPDRSCVARKERITDGAVIPQIGNPRNTVSQDLMSGTVAASGGSNPDTRCCSATATCCS